MNETESFDACSRRELVEEIGPDHALELVRTAGPFPDHFYGGIYQVRLFHYYWHGGRIRLNAEHTDYAWVGPTSYRHYKVMAGVDEDLAYLRIWPLNRLNQALLPAHLRHGRHRPTPRR